MSDVIERELKQQIHGWNGLARDVQERLIETRKEQQAPKPDASSRDVAVQLKYAELMAAEGLDVARPELWGLDQYRIRYRCWADAEAAVPGATNIKPVITGSDLDPVSGDPHEALAAAKADYALAAASLERGYAAQARSVKRMAQHEADLQRYQHIDDEVAAWVAAQLYDDQPTDLPPGMVATLDERSRATDRYDASRRAGKRIDGEVAILAEAKHRTAQRVRSAATACLIEQAEGLAAELTGVDRHAHELRVRLLSYAAVTGQLPHVVSQALNAPRVEAQRDGKMEAELRSRLDALIADA